MMTPLFIGTGERELLRQLRELAALHPVDMQGLTERLKLPALKKRHMRQMTAQTVYLPAAYAVTLSIEFNHPQGRTARHMSMSVDREDRIPNQHAVWMVAEELGFTGALSDCIVWLEDLQGHGKAINIVQLLNPEEPHADLTQSH
jgi:hypothetical protein